MQGKRPEKERVKTFSENCIKFSFQTFILFNIFVKILNYSRIKFNFHFS